MEDRASVKSSMSVSTAATCETVGSRLSVITVSLDDFVLLADCSATVGFSVSSVDIVLEGRALLRCVPPFELHSRLRRSSIPYLVTAKK